MMKTHIILENQIGFNLYRLSLLFRRELLHCLAEFALTPEQWQALVTLWNNDRLSQSEIASVTLQDAPTVSRMLARMERDGWIQREEDVVDQRISRVILTQAGHELADVLPTRVLSHFGELLQPFSEEKRAHLLGLLKELRVIFEAIEEKEDISR